jgi:competence protein ComEC
VKTFFKPLRPASFFIFITLMAGILAGNIFPDDKTFTLPAILCLSVFLCLFLCFNKKFAFLILLGLVFCCGYLSIQIKLTPCLPSHHISNYLDSKKTKIIGRVVSFKRHYKKKYTLTVLVQAIETKDNAQKSVTGKIKLSVYGSSKKNLEFGDMILFKSAIKPIRNFMNPGAFDYKRFLKLKGIYGTAYTDQKKIKILNQMGQIGFFLQLIRKIENLRTTYYEFVSNHNKDSKAAKIFTSLITGKKEVIPLDMRDLFSKAGISHLLAISGLHLSIVSLLFFSLFYRILSFSPRLTISGKSKKIAGVLSIFPLVGYAIFSGFSPSTQRALIMIIVIVFSFISEREKDIVSSLSIAGIIILSWDSASLFSISFQLSFMAIVFIFGGCLLLKKYSLMIKKNIMTKMGLMGYVTFFAGLGTFPLTAHYFNIVSTIALVSNFIFIPVIGFIVLPLGLVSFVCSFYFPFFALFIIDVCTWILLVSIQISNFLVSIPFAWSRLTGLQWNEIVAIYLVFILIFLGLKGHKKSLLPLFAMTLLLVIFNFSTFFLQKTSNLKITILDVGQGSSALIQTAEGKNILVDGGGFFDASSFDTGRFIIAPFLWQKKIQTLDHVILTHPESDHLNGLIYILDNFDVGTFIKNEDQNNSEPYAILMKICKEKNIRIWNPLTHTGQLNLGTTKLIFYDSFKDNFSADFNNNSLVFKVVHNKFSMLFTGDILRHREKNLSATTNINLYSNVLLSPHHGSLTSSTELFLDKVQPKTIVISCGWHNSYGFPHPGILKRYKKLGVQIFRTDEDGAIFITSDGKNYTTKSFIVR